MLKSKKVGILLVGYLLGSAVFVVSLAVKIYTKASSRGVLVAMPNCHDCVGGTGKTS